MEGHIAFVNSALEQGSARGADDAGSGAGTEQVGRRLASKLVELGHAVTHGSRTADNAPATEWARETGGAHGTFADAELVINATSGTVSLAALTAAGAANPRGKVIVDVSNAQGRSALLHQHGATLLAAGPGPTLG